MFNRFVAMISECANDGFFNATEKLDNYISSTDDFMDILTQIGTIPESIAHDSTEEKLFAKASDSVLARAFRELGLNSKVLTERGDSADIIASSPIHGYTLVADAKAFRLSRTAINPKDFKIVSLSGWRNDSDYAVLCAPYFQYPQTQSQIYAQSIDNNVCLLGWEHLIFLIQRGIIESEVLNFARLWNFGEKLSHSVVVADKKKNFIHDFNIELLTSIGWSEKEFSSALTDYMENIAERGDFEKAYWENEREKILKLTREQAIDELIKSKKINEKIRQIDLYVRGICRD